MDAIDWTAHYDRLRQRRAKAVRQIATIVALMIDFYMLLVMEILLQPPERTIPLPYHTSALTGAQWVAELMVGHPKRIRTELGVSHDVFRYLLQELYAMGRTASRHVSLHEQLAIFLYMAVTGNTIRHTGERFQRSNGTIAK